MVECMEDEAPTCHKGETISGSLRKIKPQAMGARTTTMGPR